MTTRRSFLGGLAGAVVPVQTASPLIGSTAATALAHAVPDEQIGHGDEGSPMFLVGLEDSYGDSDTAAQEALDEYLSGATGRYAIRTHEGFDGETIATVAIPQSDIGLGILDRIRGAGLASKDYVAWVDPNITVSYAEPLRTPNLATSPEEVAFDAPNRWAARSTPDVTGLAFGSEVEDRPIGDGWVAVNGRDHGVAHGDLTIAVIDTGVNDTPALEDDSGNTRILPESADVTGQSTETGIDAVADGDGHGTWVAECTAANADQQQYTGLLPDANVLAIKALGDDGSASTDSIVRGVEYAIDQGADMAWCMSLGSPLYSEALSRALKEATEVGMFVAVAAGNDRFGTTFVNSPASTEPATAVTACTAHDDVTDAQIAYFANGGPHDGVLDQSGGETAGATPQLAAPGMALETASGDALSGTSMAAPYVAAAAGLLIADGVAPEDVSERLTSTAEPMPQAATNETLHGRLDVEAALEDDEPDDEQADVMDSNAQRRDAELEAYSAARGGFVTRSRVWIDRLRF